VLIHVGGNGLLRSLFDLRRGREVGESLRQVDGAMQHRLPRHLPDHRFGKVLNLLAEKVFGTRRLNAAVPAGSAIHKRQTSMARPRRFQKWVIDCLRVTQFSSRTVSGRCSVWLVESSGGAALQRCDKYHRTGPALAAEVPRWLKPPKKQSLIDGTLKV